MECSNNQEQSLKARLKVNGKEIKLNNFVQGFICRTVIGMIESLQGIRDIETIDLSVSSRQKELK